jgi:hypothetical protein
VGDVEIRENGASVTVSRGDRVVIRIPENVKCDELIIFPTSNDVHQVELLAQALGR